MANQDDDFSSAVARLVQNEKRLLAPLVQLPPVEIVALTSPMGAGALGDESTGEWALRLVLAAWRTPGGPLRREPLFVRKIADGATIDRLVAALPSNGLVRLTLRFPAPAAGVPALAVLDEILTPPAEDAELAPIAAERAAALAAAEAAAATQASRPPVADVSDRRLGTLRWSEAASEWEGRTVWGRREARLVVRQPVGADAQATLAAARTTLERRAAWGRKLRAHIVGEILPLKNGPWLGDGERTVSESRLLRTLVLHTIEVEGDGRVSFWYSDGDLFGSHDVRIRGRLDDASLECSLVG